MTINIHDPATEFYQRKIDEQKAHIERYERNIKSGRLTPNQVAVTKAIIKQHKGIIREYKTQMRACK